MCVAVPHIDCIVFRNLLEVNDVPEIPAYDESNVNTIIYSSDDLAQLCETITTAAACFQDAASTGASLIPVPGSPPYRTDRNPVNKPALPLASVISRYSYNPFRTCPRRRRSRPTPPVQSRARCPACHTHAEFASCPSYIRRKPIHNLVKTLVNTCRLSLISRELSYGLPCAGGHDPSRKSLKSRKS